MPLNSRPDFTDYKNVFCARKILRHPNRRKRCRKIRGRRAHQTFDANNNNNKTKRKKVFDFLFGRKAKVEKKYIFIFRSLQIKKFVWPLLGRYWWWTGVPAGRAFSHGTNSKKSSHNRTQAEKRKCILLHTKFLLHCFARKRPTTTTAGKRRRDGMPCAHVHPFFSLFAKRLCIFLLLATTPNIGLD